MLNNQDDNKYETQEDSEYHFSDDEVSYDAEQEQERPKIAATEAKENSIMRIIKSKRILISSGVFLVLVFVVYKMVAPSSVQPVEISPSPPIAQHTVVPAKPPGPAAPVMAAKPAAPVIPPPSPLPAAAPNLPSPGTMAAAQPASVAPVVSSQPNATPTIAPNTPGLPAQPPVASMPAIIPVQTSAPTLASTPPSVSTTPITQTGGTSYQIPGADNANAIAAMMTEERTKLMNQLQADYDQKLSNFAMQNKVLESQMQALDARVAGLQSQINQLLKAFQTQSATGGDRPASSSPHAEIKVPYNVQAIIPGRAWLKSDNGETITVAEGDTIRNLGRITKIDPYDGVVEINTGNKQFSLSYGNGG